MRRGIPQVPISKQIDVVCEELQEMASFMPPLDLSDLHGSISKLKSISEQLKSAKEVVELESSSYQDKPAKKKTDGEMDRGKSSTEEEQERVKSSTDEETEEERQRRSEEDCFAYLRTGWESLWGHNGQTFEHLTALNPMLFTPYTPGSIPRDAVARSTLQILSIKIAEIKKDFEWPLEVYGVVAARDVVDRHRNPLFHRPRDDCQIITQDDPFLCLNGPRRAIVPQDEPVDIEIQLIVKGTAMCQDKSLITQLFPFRKYDGDSIPTCIVVDNYFCTMELCWELVKRSVQATILSVRVVEQGTSSPFKYGRRIVCSSLPRDTATDDDVEPPLNQVFLLDSKDGKMSMGRHGYLNLSLSRQVVSVESGGKLKLVVHDNSPSGDIITTGHALLTAKKYKTSQDICYLGDSEVEITVAWSLLVEDQEAILLSGYVNSDSLF